MTWLLAVWERTGKEVEQVGSLIYLSTETNSHLPNTVKCKSKLSKDCKPGKQDSFIPQKYARHPNYKPWVTKEPKHYLSLKINK